MVQRDNTRKVITGDAVQIIIVLRHLLFSALICKFLNKQYKTVDNRYELLYTVINKGGSL